MNKIEQYDDRYQSVRQKVTRPVMIDVSLVDDLIAAADVPIDALMTVDEDDKERKDDLMRQPVERLLGYFATHVDMRERVFAWLSPYDDDPQPGAILLYGAGGTARPRQAAELYARSRQPIIISDADATVREKFQSTLMERGVEKANIIIEDRARNYLENAYYSLAYVAERASDARYVTIVTEALVARRALLASELFNDRLLTLQSYPMLVDEEHRAKDTTAPDTWYKSELGMEMLINELTGFRLYERFGLIRRPT